MKFKHWKKISIMVLVMSFSLFLLPNESSASDWKHYTRGVELMKKGDYNGAITELNKAVTISPKASTLRQLAISYEKTNQFQEAAETYYQEAEVHRKLGNLNTYQAVKNLGDALHSETSIYTSQYSQLPTQQFGKYEPKSIEGVCPSPL